VEVEVEVEVLQYVNQIVEKEVVEYVDVPVGLYLLHIYIYRS